MPCGVQSNHQLELDRVESRVSATVKMLQEEKGALQTQVNVLEEQQESLYLQVQTAAMVQVCPQSIRSSICYMANALRRVKQKMNCCAESA